MMNQNKSEMAFIPGGIFMMGSDDGNSNEIPVHEVEIAPFHLDRTVVTNMQYQEFLQANPTWQKDGIDPEMADNDYLNIWFGNEYPAGLAGYAVINVSWFAATAYASWLGKRLPTEAEWEFAAGGPKHFKWSHGDTFDLDLYSFSFTDDPIGFRVRSYPPNDYDLFEMSGGVWEWTQDSYEVNFYERTSRINPVNVIENSWKALRGGSSHFDNPSYLRCAVRGSNDPRSCHEDYGFRCAL